MNNFLPPSAQGMADALSVLEIAKDAGKVRDAINEMNAAKQELENVSAQNNNLLDNIVREKAELEVLKKEVSDKEIEIKKIEVAANNKESSIAPQLQEIKNQKLNLEKEKAEFKDYLNLKKAEIENDSSKSKKILEDALANAEEVNKLKKELESKLDKLKSIIGG